MTFANEGEWDRAVRMLAGIPLLYAGWGGFTSRPLGIVLLIGGLVALATGIIGWCPAYTALGFSTRKTPVGQCPHCDSGQRA
jgi:hypothetical protein